ncbi:MAG: hypothetical protein HGN29_05480 [Asgard group archaeon]|nr:hypothetical protein [Asgard group archaeon]
MKKNNTTLKNHIFVFLLVANLCFFLIPFQNDISLTKAATGIYSEDFTTTAFMDGTNTNTSGWGTGSIENSKQKPTLVGSISSALIGNALNVFVEGDYAHIAAAESGYQLVNVTDLSDPSKISAYDTAGQAMNLHVDGEYVYIADDTNGLVILNITDPLNPTFTGSDSTYDLARDVAVYGEYAYVADSNSGLTIVDISNPEFPSTLNSYVVGGTVYSVTIEGRNAYITNGIELQIIDISNPTSLSLIGSVSCSDAYDVAIDGNTAFISAQERGVLIVNITDLQSPHIIGSYSDTYSIGIDVDGDYVYTTDFYGFLNVIDVSDLKNPKLGTSCTIPVSQGLFVVNENAFIACYTNGFYIFNIKNQFEPSFLNSYDTPSIPWGVYVSGDYAYVADYESGVQILNISDPSSPVYVGSYNTPWRAYDIIIDGDYAYITDGPTIQILNVSNPSSPTFLGSYLCNDQSVNIIVSGDFAYVAEYSGLEILDISDPTSPSQISFHSTSVYTLGVDVAGDYAYTAISTNGIQILDISNPVIPKVVGTYDTPGQAYEIEVEGDLAYVVDQADGLLIFDVSDHSSPILIGACDTPGNAISLFVSGNYVYVGDYQGDFLIIDTSDPTNPIIVGTYETPSDTNDCFVHGDYAFVACVNNGLHIIEIGKNKARQYDSSCIAQSTSVYSDSSFTLISTKLISNALVPADTSVKYYLSSDNGVNWEEVTNNTEHIFSNIGYQLRWKTVLSTINISVTPEIYSIFISYKTTLISPSLTSPLDSAIIDEYTPNFGWDIISGATDYLFQLDTSTTFITPLLNITIPSSSTSYTTNSPLALGTYYWRVAGIDSEGDIGEFSKYRTLDVILDENPPTIDNPSDISYEQGMTGNTITWTPVDSNPYWYNITLNGILTSYDDPWLGGDIIMDIDGLPLGIYTLVCYVYDLEGLMISDTVNVEVISTAPPTIDDVVDFAYEEGDTGNSITWHPSDANPDWYTITKDGIVLRDDIWLGGDLNINIDGLTYGVYTYVCTVNDTEGQEASDTVIVTVTDSVAPVLNSPGDIVYSQGDTGNNIIWIATDTNPATYIVYKDGTLYEPDTWTSGSSIVIPVDGLAAASYNFTIVVFDEAGNSVKDEVTVAVTPAVPEFTQSIFFTINSITAICITYYIKRKTQKKS